ncbi:MAG: 16S rRNA (cytosine(967)-C(5))-methyltransferase RsmB [Lachnospiraceae bacterium]|nr:16S rRNA (cytosine(967)-C(5))-methyltransferase RsmB [Lachnospiraceae bacterium]
MVKEASVNPRLLALEILLEAEKGEKKATELIRGALDKADDLPRRDKAFIRRLSGGVIERRITLDHCIDAFASTKTRRMKPAIRQILRMGCYQLLYMDSVPASAAVNESVALAARKGFAGLKGFVNAVLRNVERNKENIPMPSRKEDLPLFLSVSYSMPRWIVERFLSQYGERTAERMLAAALSERPVCVRVCGDADKLRGEWEAQGVTVEEEPRLPGVLFLRNVPGVEQLAGFAEGGFFVQDTASMLAVKAAGIRPGEKVIDLCAAPGGKSIAASFLCGSSGSVRSFDISDAKLERIRENALRLKRENIEVLQGDARCRNAALLSAADVLIADLPCSGLGVLGRKPDIRYRVQEEDIGGLRALQREILWASLDYLKPGGRLLYSTCTVTEEENEGNYHWLLENFPLHPVDIYDRVPEALVKDTARQGYMQLLCGEPEGLPLTDGFFFAVFERTEA